MQHSINSKAWNGPNVFGYSAKRLFHTSSVFILSGRPCPLFFFLLKLYWDIIHIPYSSLIWSAPFNALSIFKDMCNHPSSQPIWEHFPSSQEEIPHPLSVTLCVPILLSPSIIMNFFCLDRYPYSGLSSEFPFIWYVVFYDWLLSLTICFQGPPMLRQVLGFHSFLFRH